MLPFSGVYNDDLEIEGAHLDIAQDCADNILIEIFPDTTVELLPDWERVFNINVPSGATVLERQSVVSAKWRATGGLTKSYFEGIAESLGYIIGAAGSQDPHCRIADGQHLPFRADYGQADIGAIWDQDSGANQYTWEVYGTGVESNSTLQDIFNDLKPAGTEIVFINE